MVAQVGNYSKYAFKKKSVRPLIYSIKISAKYKCLCVQLNGTLDFESGAKIFSEIAIASLQKKLFTVLIVSEMDSMNSLEAFRYKIMFKNAGFTEKHKIVWVENQKRGQRLDRFITIIFENQGEVKSRIFSEKIKALSWISCGKKVFKACIV